MKWLRVSHVQLALLLILPALIYCETENKLTAQDGEAARLSIDPGKFLPELFPDLETQSVDVVYLTGLATLYPGKVLDHSPPEVQLSADAEPVFWELPRNITYIRIRDLKKALPLIEDKASRPCLILDFRFVATDAETTREFVEKVFPGYGLDLQYIGNCPEVSADQPPPDRSVNNNSVKRPVSSRKHPVIILVNDKTAGPIEVVLEALESEKAIITIGRTTAGLTGQYEKVDPALEFFILCGEYRVNGSPSLTGIGYEPFIRVETSSLSDNRAYHTVKQSEDLQDWISIEADPSSSGATRGLNDKQNEEINNNRSRNNNYGMDRELDFILQKGINIIVALQVLGRMPDS